MPQKQIKFGISFNTDLSGLNSLKQSLNELSNLKIGDLSSGLKEPKNELENIKQLAFQLKSALASSFNIKLGTLNLQKFKQELNINKISIQQIGTEFAKAGIKGQQAFNNLAQSLTTTRAELKETHKLLDSIGTTLANTVKWSIASSALQNFTGSIQKAYSFTKQLDESLNDIRIVTGKSADEMDKFAVRANKAAAALGKTTKDYTTASLLFYQQGLSDKDVQARTNVTLKAANVTGQSTSEVSEQLTAIWNGYKVSAQEAETYIDKVAAVAASTASDLEELSEGMSKVAAAANNMGVDIDQLNAQLSTIISVTRQDAGVAGTALKTIYARMTDIESGLDTETTLGNYTAEMAKFGIQVLDAKGGLRDVGDVMDEIGGKWTSFTREQQVALAQAMAGTRQYNNLMALFGNWDMYTKSLETSREAMGTLQNQQDIYMESLEAHIEQLTAKGEKLYNALFDTDSFKSILDILTSLVDVLGDFVNALGGGGVIITQLGGILLNLFSNQIGRGIGTAINNLMTAKQNAEELKQALDFTKQIKSMKDMNVSTEEWLAAREKIYILSQKGFISKEETEQLQKNVELMAQLADERDKMSYDTNKDVLNAFNKEVKNKGIATKASDLINFEAIANMDEENSVENAQNDVEIFTTQVEKLKEHYQEMGERANSYFEIQKKLSHEWRQAGAVPTDELKAYNAELKDGWKSMQETAQSFEHMGLVSEETRQAIQESKNTYVLALKEFDKEPNPKSYAALRNAFIDFQKNINQAKEEAQGAIDQVDDYLSKRIDGSVEKNKEQMKSLGDGIQKGLEKVKPEVIAQGISKVAGSVTAAIGVVSSLSNIFNTLKDDSKSAGDQVKTVLLGMVGLIPSIVSIITSLTSLTAAEWAAMGPWLALIAIVGVFAVVTTKAILSVIDEFKKEEKAVEKANEALKTQINILQEAKSAQDAFNKSIEKYKNAQNAIKELTIGTQEWTNALRENNDQVLDLIAAYPELAASVKREIVNGQVALSIEDQAFANVQATQANIVNAAYQQKLAAQNNARSAQATLTAKELNKELGIGQGTENLGGTIAGSLLFSPYGFVRGMQSAINSFSSGDIGAGIGKVLLGPIGGIFASMDDQAKAQQKATAETEKALTLIAEDYIENGEEAFFHIDETLTDFSSGLVTELKSNTKALKENVAAMAANISATRLANEQIMSSYLATKGGADYQNADQATQSATSAVAAEIYAKEFEKQLEEYRDRRGGKKDATIQEEYARLMGYDKFENLDGNKGRYRYWNEEAQEYQWKEIDDDIARRALAQKAAQKEAAKAVSVASVESILSLVGNNDVLKSTLASMAGGRKSINLANLTRSNIEELQKLTTADLTSLEEQIKQFGYDSVTAFKQAIEISIKNANETLADILSRTSNDSIIKLLGEDGLLANLNNTDKRTVVDYTSKLTQNGQNALAALLEKAGEKNASAFINSFANFDWTQNDVLFKFNKELQSLGINLEEADLTSFTEEIVKLNEGYGHFDAEKAQQVYSSINKIALSLKNVGDTVSEEEFNTLTGKLQQYFIKMADGTYALTVSASEFYDAVIQGAEEAYKAQLKENQDRINQLNEYINTGANEGNSELVKQATADAKALTESTLGNFNDEWQKEYQNQFREEWRDKSGGHKDITAQQEYAKKLAQDYGVDISQINIKDLWNNKARYTIHTADGDIVLDEVSDIIARNAVADEAAKAAYIQAHSQELSKLGVNINQSNDKILEEWATKSTKDRRNKAIQDARDAQIEEWKKEQANLTTPEREAIQRNRIAQLGTVAQLEAFKETVDNDEIKDEINKRIKLIQNQNKEFLTLEQTVTDYDNKLKKLNNDYAKLEQISSTLFGKEYVDNLKEQAKLSADIAKTAQERAKAIRNQLYDENGNYSSYSTNRINNVNDLLRSEYLQKTLAELGINIEEADLGKLLSGKQSIASYLSAANEVINNTAQGSQERAIAEDLKERLESLQDIVEMYLVDLPEAEAEATDKAIASTEKRIASYHAELDMLQNVKDMVSSYSEFLRDIDEDNYSAISKSYLLDANIASNMLNKLYEERQQILNAEIKTEQDLNALVANTQQIQQETLALQESLTQAEETRLTLAEKITEQYESQSKYYDMMRQTLRHQINMAKLLYGDSNYTEQVKYYSELYDKTNKMLEVSAKQVATTQAAYEALKNSDSDAAKKAYEDYIQAQKQYLDSIEDTLEAAQEKFENVILGAFEVFANNLAGGRFTDALSQYNWQQEFNQENMTGMRRELNISNVGIAYQRAINEYAGDTSAQARLTALYREQVALLRDKEYLNRNDITLAEKRLALEKARIDLENARSDTSTMRLVRGAGGEYSYQYVANEDNILSKIEALNKAELDYADSMNEAVKSGLDMYQTIMDLWHEFAQASTDEERNQILSRIKDVFAAMGEAFKGLDISDAPQELIKFITALRNGDTDEGLKNLMERAQELASEFSTIQKTLGDDSDESSETLIKSLDIGVEKTQGMVDALEDQVSSLDELISKSSEYASNLAVAKDNALMASEALIASAAALNGIDLNGFSVSANPMRSLSGIVYSMSNIGALHSATEGANAVENTQNNSNNTEVNGQQIVQYISAQFPGVTTVSQIIEALEKIGTESVQENG